LHNTDSKVPLKDLAFLLIGRFKIILRIATTIVMELIRYTIRRSSEQKLHTNFN